MIDTLQLMLTAYDTTGAKLQVQPSTFDSETGEMKSNYPLFHDGSKMVSGKLAYHRDEHFNVKIQPMPSLDGNGISMGCFVRFEVPKFAGGHNYHEVGFKGLKSALNDASKCLDSIGIKTNIQSAKISRLDAFKNAVLDEPFSNYQPVLQLLSGSRMKQRGYESGFLWENTRQQICAYDKIQKMLHDKHSISGLPKNTGRFELRLMQAAKVRDTLQFHSVKDLLNDYDRIQRVYQDTMQKQLFKYAVKDVEVLFASELKSELMFYRDQYGRNWMQKYFMDYGLYSLLQKSSIETVLSVFDEIEEEKSKKSRLKSKLKEMRFSSAALSLVPASSRTTGELYSELEEKILAA